MNSPASIEYEIVDFKKNVYQNLRFLYPTKKAKSKIIYTRRYNLDADFDSISTFFQIPQESFDNLSAVVSEIFAEAPSKTRVRKLPRKIEHEYVIFYKKCLFGQKAYYLLDSSHPKLSAIREILVGMLQ